MNNLTLLIPVKNETESLEIFLEELDSYKFQKLLVIDCNDSNDYSYLLSKYTNCTSIKTLEKGYGQALIDGINKIETKFFCIINADGSMDPKDLTRMLKETKDYSFIFASRYISYGGSDDDTVITYIGNKFFSFFGKLFFKLNISDILYTYVLGDTKLAKNLDLKKTDFRICVELPIKVKQKKYSYRDIYSYERSRIGGKKKVNAFKDGFLILFEMFNLFFKKNN